MSNPSESAAPKANYFVIWALIAGLIFLAVCVSFMNLGPSTIYANLAIAITQGFLLLYFFMHLKEAESFIWLTVGSGIFFTFILFLFLLNDYVTRNLAAY